MTLSKEQQHNYQKQWAKDNPEKIKAAQKKYYNKNKNKISKKRSEYQKKYRIDHREEVKEYNKTHWSLHGKELNKKESEKRKIIRNEIIQLFGGKCNLCGFTDIRALQIDHINGTGVKHRNSIGSRYQKMILIEIKNGSNKYQLLCANCNWIKRTEENELPYHFHEKTNI